LDHRAGIPTTFRIVPEHSAVLVRARSNVGPISFGTSTITGQISCKVGEGSLGGLEEASGRLEIQALSLVSGNALYDAELHRRIDARRHPNIVVELSSAAQIGDSPRFLLAGDICLRDITQLISGAVTATFTGPDCLLFTGEHALDIRDFRIEVPSTLMLKIYPDVTVEMHLEACAG
jgi:YceI-like domain